MNDDFCDPLELRPESFLGVPGLVEAVRAGEVAVVNPLGSGVAQTEALLPFLPAICRRLLGEELQLPSVPTYWCGDAEGISIGRVSPRGARHQAGVPVGAVRADLRPRADAAKVSPTCARGSARTRRKYVAQERVDLSVVPSLAGDELSPGRFWMRTYAVASGDGYTVMPGALSRVGGPAERFVLSLEPGGESKDTWVLASGPVQALSLLPPPSAPVELSRDDDDLPSRIADNLFWLGRYVERAEGTARLVRAVAVRLSDPSGSSDSDQASGRRPPPAHARSADVRAPAARRSRATRSGAAPRGRETPGRWLLGAVFDPEPGGTLRATLAETHRVARSLRDWLSHDSWRARRAPRPGAAQTVRRVGSRAPRAPSWTCSTASSRCSPRSRA